MSSRSSKSSLYKIAISLAVPLATLYARNLFTGTRTCQLVINCFDFLGTEARLPHASYAFPPPRNPPKLPKLPNLPKLRALGPAHRSRIGPRRVLPQFHDLFIEVSVSPMLPRFSLRLPCFRARDAPFRPQCKGNAPNSVMMK